VIVVNVVDVLPDDVDPKRFDVDGDVNNVVRYDGKLPTDDIDSGPEFQSGLSAQCFNADLSFAPQNVLKEVLTAASAQLAS
jgi:hypothetical protein